VIEYLAEYQDRDCGTVDAAILGDALIDYQYWVAKLPSTGGDETISMSNKSCGGSAANTAIALGQLHLRTAFCGRVGADDNGRWIVEKMKTQKCSLISMDAKTSKRIFVKLCTRPNADVQQIYDSLKFKNRPYVRKTKVVTQL